MSKTYTVGFNNQTVIASGTLVIIHTATGVARGSLIEVLRAWASQQATTTAQQIGIQLGTKASAFGTYTGATPAPHSLGGPASGIASGTAGAAATAGVYASVEGAGTFTPAVQDAFANQNGWLWVPTPEERILVPADTAICLKLTSTPTTLTGWSGGITYRELV